ncbi:MAG TPA: lysophospholipid acyltransferase family protein [Mariniphaga sp.]|nr:lysophospholipid acyltransferase family protein [Mariniphaga sp.]
MSISGKINPVQKKQASSANNPYHEGILKRNLNKLPAGFLYLISLLPFMVLYIVSDIFYLIVRYVIKYRYRVVMENLTHSFPENSKKENQKIANRFYRHFADLMIETIKLHSVSKDELDKRVQLEGQEIIHEYYKQGKSFIVLAMHHNNWEWCSYLLTKIKHKGLLIYNPIRGNKSMEKFLLHSRERWGGKCIPVNQSARVALQFHRDGIPTMLWLGADQTPPANSQFWTIFLNRETPFFTGPEKIAQKTNQPVFFQYMSKLKRGQYITRYIPLVINPSEMEPKDILLAYIEKMEEIIKKEPEYYLWSHRRWKHTRPENIPLTLP